MAVLLVIVGDPILETLWALPLAIGAKIPFPMNWFSVLEMLGYTLPLGSVRFFYLIINTVKKQYCKILRFILIAVFSFS